MKTVAITGSAGFIGSNLVEGCLKKGWKVIGIDNFATGFKEMADPNRVSHLPGKYRFAELDINETEKLKEVFNNCESVFHLAALARVPFSIDHPLEANMANINGTLSVLEAARKAGVRRVIFSSSSSIFGGSNVHPTPETTEMVPLSPYALHKATGTEYCRLYSEIHGLETVSLIYYNVFGRYQTGNSAYATVIPAFFDAALKNKKCRIDGNGKQSRDFTYVDNVVCANILAAEFVGVLKGEKFNIANGEFYSVNKIFETINGFFGGNLKSYSAPKRLGDPFKSQADIRKAKEILNYMPIVGFKDGMRKTHEWWKKII